MMTATQSKRKRPPTKMLRAAMEFDQFALVGKNLFLEFL